MEPGNTLWYWTAILKVLKILKLNWKSKQPEKQSTLRRKTSNIMYQNSKIKRLYPLLISTIVIMISCIEGNSQEAVRFVNPFIGTSNFGATNPGAIAPRGMASVSPFNVAGDQNVLEKDSRWLSNPYVNENTFLKIRTYKKHKIHKSAFTHC